MKKIKESLDKLDALPLDSLSQPEAKKEIQAIFLQE
jgi:hypothetical protein